MTRKVLTTLTLIASLIGATGVHAQQQECDAKQATPQTDDDCTLLGGLWGSGAGAGAAIVGGTLLVGVALAGGGSGGGGGGETPNTLPGQ